MEFIILVMLVLMNRSYYLISLTYYLLKDVVLYKNVIFFLILDGFKGDLLLTVRLLLPGVIKRVYNLQSKQIVKLFSRVSGYQCKDSLFRQHT